MNEEKVEQLKQPLKKLYKQPKLTHYGDISSLTQNAAGFTMDNTGKSAMT